MPKRTTDSPQPTGSASETPLVAMFHQELRDRVGEKNYNNWFVEKSDVRLNGHRVLISVASPFLQTWMQRHFRAALSAAATAALGPAGEIEFDVKSAVKQPDVDKTEPLRKTTATETHAAKPKPPVQQSLRSESAASSTAASQSQSTLFEPASPAKTPSVPNTIPARPIEPMSGRRRFADLSDYVIGPGNELAVTAAHQVCDAPGRMYNPLYVHGEVGIGKTHLLEGIHRLIRRRHPHLQILTITAETFGNFFSQAIREKGLPSFRQRFRAVDVLIIDDVQFFDAKHGFQKEFLHTFIQLERLGKQIILAGDRHPRLLTQLSDELVSRFLSGIVCRIEAPNFETRQAIAKRKADKLNCPISSAAIDYVSKRFQKNIRELEGALNCLATHHQMTGKKVSLGHARSVLSDLERDCVRVVRMTDIEEKVCEAFGVDEEALRGRGRQRAITQPRMIAMYLTREVLGSAYSEIGRHYGGRNHSTVLSAEKKVRGWMEGEMSLHVGQQTWRADELVNSLKQQIAAG